MINALVSGQSLWWDYLCQSTLFLGMGLIVSALIARRAARAHQLLLMAAIAALLTPLLAQAANRGGWGILSPRADQKSAARAPITVEVIDASSSRAPWSESIEPRSRQPEQGGLVKPTVEPRVVIPALSGARRSSWAHVLRPVSTGSWRTLFLTAWLILTVLSATRLALSVLISVITVRRASPLEDGQLVACAIESARKLGVPIPPELRIASSVRCPSIWCWRSRPVILLPEGAASNTTVAWAGVFCHELAHWLRRDHWSSLLAELLVCALPWHPLAWWARNRLGQLSELACDDWVLATGLPGTDYAESLLSLTPQRRGVVAMGAVSSRYVLLYRIRHILHEQARTPIVGTRWSGLSTAAIVVVASAVALAQPRLPMKSQNPKLQDNTRRTSIPTVSAAIPNRKATRHSVSGTVLGPDDRPVSGVAVVWIGHRRPSLPRRALPEDQKARPENRAEVVGEARTDTSGRFSLAAEFDPDRYEHDDGLDVHLLVRAPGLGMLSRFAKTGQTEIAIRMAREVVIRGRLLAPNGRPATGVRVVLNDFFNHDDTEGMGVEMTANDDSIPHYWPKPRTTDVDGRFTLEELPQGMYAHLDLWHTDYAVDEVVVDTSAEGVTKAAQNDWAKAFEITPARPIFTHTLEPARPVQGRVTDKQTGKPLAGLLIHMIPMRRHGGMPFYARTDADGRYRVSGHSAEHYWTTVYPAADSGYIAVQDKNRSWPVGAKFLERDFVLDKGRIVRGRVIDAQTKHAIAGAAVRYRPQRKNSSNREGFEFSSTTLTDAEGRFVITALAGQGFLVVQTSDDTYLRVAFPEKGDADEVSPQGVVAIDVPNSGEPKLVEVALRKGAVLRAKVIDPAGNAATDVVASCAGINQMELLHAWQRAEKGMFQLSGADSSKTYRIFFIQPDRQLGAVIDFKPDPLLKQPVEVVLRPTAKVHGKVVTENGSPAEGAQVYPMIVMGNPKKGEMTRTEIVRNAEIYANLMGQKAIMAYVTRVLQPKPKGEFLIDTLVPGTTFYIAAGDRRRERYTTVPPLKPGEDRDLGTITLMERPR